MTQRMNERQPAQSSDYAAPLIFVECKARAVFLADVEKDRRNKRQEKPMQMVSEVMTHDVRFVAPRERLQRTAQMMDEPNVGMLSMGANA